MTGVPSIAAGRPPATPVVTRAAGAGWIFLYLGLQLACQISLLVPGLSPARVLARSAAFGASLGLLALVPGRPLTQHLGRFMALFLAALVTLSMLHPEGASPGAVIAHWAFHLSILAPMFWVSRLRVSSRSLQALFVVLWVFSTASSIVGVLQAYYPGRFLPAAGMMAGEQSARQFAALMIRLSSGAWIPRPTGLTDAPGGAAAGGFYAVLLGVGIALTRPFQFSRIAAAAATIAGMTCLYLCQVRAMIVMLLICILAILGIFAWAGRVSRSISVAVVVGVLVVAAFAFAFSLGGSTVSQRMETLISADPGTVYYGARGRYFAGMVERIPEYPLGAGLGRWGMVAYYFGGTGDLWAEIQWTGWLYDGGLAMLIAYPVAILLLLRYAVQVALKTKNPTLEVWAAVVAGYDVGTLALTFSYQVFMSTSGIEFWLINAALIQAVAFDRMREREGSPAAQPA